MRKSVAMAVFVAALPLAVPVLGDQPGASGHGGARTFSACGVLVIDEAGRVRTLWADLEERRRVGNLQQTAGNRAERLQSRKPDR